MKDMTVTAQHVTIGGIRVGEVGVVLRTPARSPHGHSVVQWCAVGAVSREAGTENSYLLAKALVALNAIAGSLFKLPVSAVNDELGHEATLAMFDKVLADETISSD